MRKPARKSINSRGTQMMRRIRFRKESHFPKVMYGTKMMAAGRPNSRPPNGAATQ